MFIDEENSLKITALWKINTNRGTHASDPRSYYCLAFKMSGVATYKCGNEVVTANAGDVIFFPKGKAFIHKHDETQMFVVNFETLEDLKPNKFEVFTVESPEQYKAMFAQMFDIWNSKDKGYLFQVTSLFYQILGMLCKEVSNQDLEKSVPKTQIIREYILRNYSDPTLSISQLSTIFGTSDSYLRRIFQKEFGMAPKRYLFLLRMSQAENLLKSGHYNITEVALQCGFTNQKYFSNVFRQEFGMTPSKYLHDSKAGKLKREIRLE
ncbi:MAG: AraC family transcriptional regulator [Sphaerochaetaceae bacterium]|nr:AraC family transcriptional regulator [Sphaerochaetaceae bacterium]